MARIRSEVLSPFRSVRMFFYLAFMASGALGGLIALTQLLPALSNPARAGGAAETLKGLGIDAAAVALFAFLYSRESKAKDAQVARLAREERLSRLKLRAVPEMAATLRPPRSISFSVPCAALGASLHSSVPFSRKPSLPCGRACRAGVRCSAANKPSPPPPTAPDSSEVR